MLANTLDPTTTTTMTMTTSGKSSNEKQWLTARMVMVVMVVNAVMVVAGISWPTYSGFVGGTTAFGVGALVWLHKNTPVAQHAFGNTATATAAPRAATRFLPDIVGALGCCTLLGTAIITASRLDGTSLAATLCLFVPVTVAFLVASSIALAKLYRATRQLEHSTDTLPLLPDSHQPLQPLSAYQVTPASPFVTVSSSPPQQTLPQAPPHSAVAATPTVPQYYVPQPQLQPQFITAAQQQPQQQLYPATTQ